MKELIVSKSSASRSIRNIRIIPGFSFILILILLILTPSFCSCNRRLNVPRQSKDMPSAYTHSGKYVNFRSLGKRRDGIKKYNLKCEIPSARR